MHMHNESKAGLVVLRLVCCFVLDFDDGEVPFISSPKYFEGPFPKDSSHIILRVIR